MKFIFFILTLLHGFTISAQVPDNGRRVSAVTVDKNFKDTFTFNNKWDYPWNIVVDDHGNMENTLGGTLMEADTVHLYHTANCWTNHQGRHAIRYCVAFLHKDTIKLNFPAELPAYASELSVSINGSQFWSNFSATYPAPPKNLSWVITRQKLVLNKNSYLTGDIVKGYLEIEFIETQSTGNEKSSGRKYYYKGYFKTPLLNKL